MFYVGSCLMDHFKVLLCSYCAQRLWKICATFPRSQIKELFRGQLLYLQDNCYCCWTLQGKSNLTEKQCERGKSTTWLGPESYVQIYTRACKKRRAAAHSSCMGEVEIVFTYLLAPFISKQIINTQKGKKQLSAKMCSNFSLISQQLR